MTPRMKDFLADAALAKEGRGLVIGLRDRWIAAKAVNDGHGAIISGGFSNTFIINKAGRRALTHANR